MKKEERFNDRKGHSLLGTEALADTYLAKMLGIEKAERLLGKYFLDLKGKLDLLHTYMKAEDMMEIRKIAHQLTGSGKSYGFQEITEIGGGLSACARGEDLSGLKGMVERLDAFLVRNGDLG
jgi:Hpt domain-containing protein